MPISPPHDIDGDNDTDPVVVSGTFDQGTPGTTPWPVLEASRTVATANYATAAANTAAVITYAAPGASVSHVIGGVVFSYSGAPTGGALTITDDGNTVFSVDITASGPGPLVFPRPMKFTANKAVVITLAAGGSGVVGKIMASSKWTE